MKFQPLVVCALVVLCAAIGRSQTLDWNITGAGARAEGLGGAFIGVADDATAIVWNPAGLTQLERTEVSAVGRYISENSEFKSRIPGHEYTATNSQSHFNFNFGSLAVPFSVAGTNVVVAAAYQTQLDFYAKESSDTSTYESTGAGSTITPGFAFRLGPVFSLGGAANIWLGTYDQSIRLSATTQEPLLRNASGSLEATFSGLNFVAGAMLDLGGLPAPLPLKFGVAVKTPFTLKRDDKFSFLYPNVPRLMNFSEKKEIEMPLMIGIGSSYRIGDNLTIAADFEMRLFQDTKFRVLDSTGALLSTDSLTGRNENLNQFRVGAEYLIVLRGGVIPIRAGFRTVPTVLANYEWNHTQGAYYSSSKVGGLGFSAGTGYISSAFALDFAYSREQRDEQKWTDAGVTDFSNTYSIDRFSLSVIVYF